MARGFIAVADVQGRRGLPGLSAATFGFAFAATFGFAFAATFGFAFAATFVFAFAADFAGGALAAGLAFSSVRGCPQDLQFIPTSSSRSLWFALHALQISSLVLAFLLMKNLL
jgi:hypothetical protein